MDRIQWPVKILLVHPQAPFLKSNNIVIAADCAALLYGELGERFRMGTPILIGCPLLEDPHRLFDKIKLIMGETDASAIDVYTMEVPCCHAIRMMVDSAIKELNKDIKINHYIVRVISKKAEPYIPGYVDETMIEFEKEAHRHEL